MANINDHIYAADTLVANIPINQNGEHLINK